MHADPPAWIFPGQACDSNYITLKQIQIIDTLVAKFCKAHDATPQHDTFKTPGQASPNPSNFGDTWKYLCTIPANLPSTKEASVCDAEAPAHSTANTEQPRSPEEEARDILATAAKNQTEDGPSTRRAAVRACKYLQAMVNQHGTLIQLAYEAAKVHTQRSKGSAATATQYRSKEAELPVIAPELTSELLHCLSRSPKCAGSFLQMNTPDAR